MSGISFATGQHLNQNSDPSLSSSPSSPSSSSPSSPFSIFRFSFVQIQLFGYILVFAVSGLVPFEEILISFIITIYSVGLSLYVFPNNSGEKPAPLFKIRRIFSVYIAVGAILGIFLPLAFLFGGFARGEKEDVSAVIPPLFLVACQLLTESIVVDINWISLPVRAFLSLLYTFRRLVVISFWIQTLFRKKSSSVNLTMWEFFGRLLAVSNGVFWSINLLFFILPFFVPRAFEKHFETERKFKEKREVSEKGKDEPPKNEEKKEK